jgi:hypothetical protein
MLIFAAVATCAQIHEFEEHDQLIIFVGGLLNPRDPLARYDSAFFTFCGYPREFQLRPEETLIAKFFEDEKSDIGIHFRFLQMAANTRVCLRGLSAADFAVLRDAIAAGFWVQFILDETYAYAPIGAVIDGRPHYYSHWSFTVFRNGPYIMGFAVEPRHPRELLASAGSPFHYSLNWTSTDAVLRFPAASAFGSFRVQFLSLLKLTLAVMVLILSFTIVLARRIARDLDSFENENEFDDFEGLFAADHSWKALHGDVFRAPAHPAFFAGVNGIALHQTVTIFSFIFINSTFGLYSTVGLGPVLALLFLACSVVSGYFGKSVALQFGDGSSQMFLRSFFCVTVPLFAMILLTTFSDKSDISTASALTMLVASFACVLPLTYVGGFMATEAPFFNANPCDVAVIPKRLPPRRMRNHPAVICPIVGFFSSLMFVQEAEIILTAMKRSMVSWLFLFLLVTLLCALVVAAALSIAVVYLLLAQEIHRWQWLAFLAPFSSAAFVFAHAVFYILTRTHLRAWKDRCVYFVYALIVAVVYGMVCGSAGFIGANAFVRSIFSNLKFE